ncbi:MAG: hypothetical protein A3I66_01220 [Burkholderiales bacterium RIFCSPLOWO2_02_FULL_57_36]|nr:MAG: hypothetical protein A3I66_01220 [Burkholderiales bacterium RIFCSPLOWO2_02_FULL_57_36]
MKITTPPVVIEISVRTLFRRFNRWRLARAERHYILCADVEQERAREAHLNVAYYQKQAAMARSAQINL